MDGWSPWPVLAGTVTVLVGAVTVGLFLYRRTTGQKSAGERSQAGTSPASPPAAVSERTQSTNKKTSANRTNVVASLASSGPGSNSPPSLDGVRIAGDYAEAGREPRIALSAEEETARSSMLRRLEMCMGELPREMRQEMCAAIIRDIHWQQQHGAGRLAEPSSRAFLRGQESTRPPRPGAQGMAAMLPRLPDPRVQAAKAGRGRDFRSTNTILTELLTHTLRDAGVSQLSTEGEVNRSSLERLVAHQGLVAPFRTELREALTRKFAKHPDRAAHPRRYPCLREVVAGGDDAVGEAEAAEGQTKEPRSGGGDGKVHCRDLPTTAAGEDEVAIREEELDARVEALLADVAAAAESLD